MAEQVILEVLAKDQNNITIESVNDIVLTVEPSAELLVVIEDNSELTVEVLSAPEILVDISEAPSIDVTIDLIEVFVEITPEVEPRFDITLEGSQGPSGPRGAKGNTGDKGDKGDTGDVGPVGPQGLTNFIVQRIPLSEKSITIDAADYGITHILSYSVFNEINAEISVYVIINITNIFIESNIDLSNHYLIIRGI